MTSTTMQHLITVFVVTTTIQQYALADVSRPNIRHLIRMSLQSNNCLSDELLHDNLTQHLYRDGFTVGSKKSFLYTIEQEEWVNSMLHCVVAFETANKNPIHNASNYHKGKYCYGSAGSKVIGMCLNDGCDLTNSSDLVSTLASMAHPISVSKKSLSNPVCIKTEWETPWYRKLVPLFELSVQMLLVSVAVAAAVNQLICPYSHDGGCLKKFFLCFSLKLTIQKLVSIPSNPDATIRCFFGLRVLSVIWTIAGHSFMVLPVFLDNKAQFLDSLRDSFFGQLVTNFTLCTDVFFLLGGALAAYGWFRKIGGLPKAKHHRLLSVRHWLCVYRHRIVRLWPTYAFTMFSLVGRYSVSAPHGLWPEIDVYEQCPKYWWQNLLFVNSLYPNLCMPWCWYFGTDFIFYLLSPLFLMAIYYRPKLGVSLTIVTIALSSILRALITFGYNFPPLQFFWFSPPQHYNQEIFSQHVLLYIKPYTRIGSYLIGILLGYLLTADCKHLQAVFTQRNTIGAMVQFVGWLLSAIGLFCTVFGAYPAIQNWGDGVSVGWRVYDLVYVAIHRVIFSISVGWLIFMCHLGGVATAPLNWLLGHRMLVLWANLSYGAYLFHPQPIVGMYVLSRPLLVQWQGFGHHLIGYLAGQVLVSYLCGLFLAVMIEYPTQHMERLFLRWRNSKKSDIKGPAQAVQPLTLLLK